MQFVKIPQPQHVHSFPFFLVIIFTHPVHCWILLQTFIKEITQFCHFHSYYSRTSTEGICKRTNSLSWYHTIYLLILRNYYTYTSGRTLYMDRTYDTSERERRFLSIQDKSRNAPLFRKPFQEFLILTCILVLLFLLCTKLLKLLYLLALVVLYYMEVCQLNLAQPPK